MGAHDDEPRRQAGPPRLLASSAAFAWNRCENAFVTAWSMQDLCWNHKQIVHARQLGTAAVWKLVLMSQVDAMNRPNI